MSPTQRSLATLREAGFVAAVVEKWNPHARIRQDLFGFIDIVALRAGQAGLLAIQACVTGDQAKRLEKIRQNATTALWLGAGNRLAVWGWAKRGPRGKRKLWTLSETNVTPGVLSGAAGIAPKAPHPGAERTGGDHA